MRGRPACFDCRLCRGDQSHDGDVVVAMVPFTLSVEIHHLTPDSAVVTAACWARADGTVCPRFKTEDCAADDGVYWTDCVAWRKLAG